ncbi:MAG: hypothetical protein UV40_C0003G0002 [Parcubacteria group bacterium GW2011_GWA1_42_7]|nr:MAG: hypothetical protein UV40_C0003G0002 [Parcubacteria group bacterium GW2011_GWA1_42_7]KKS92412.1 MAG: hypothetical protein UV67_C0004G0006 [Parcubacteria group bacterium GW2011_GWC1_43_12]
MIFKPFHGYNSPMTRNKRRLIFYLFVLIFLISVPPTILYTAGYSFDWKNWRLAKTGGLYIKSTPNQAQIFIDGEKERRTPSLFSHLAPRAYNVKIEMEGYHSWEKNLNISPKLVTEARSVLLIPTNPQAELLSQNATTTIKDFLENSGNKKKQGQALNAASSTPGWILKDNEIFYISEENRNLYRSNLNGSLKEQISKNPLPEHSSYEIIASNDRNKFAVITPQKELFLLNDEMKILESIASGIIGAEFSNDNKRLLFFSESEIWVLYAEEIMLQPYKKPGEKEMITRFAQKIEQAIFYPDNDHICFVIENKIKIIELDGRDRRNIADFITAKSPQIYYDFGNENFYYLSENNLFRIKLKK